ncbi:MAG: Gfo/Idh/MocA family oxidoreductase [Pyrinomonadaceae bacterium]
MKLRHDPRLNPDVDAICPLCCPTPCTPNTLVRGAQAGKHILCEKPVADTPKDCEQMIEASPQSESRVDGSLYRLRHEPYQPNVDQNGARKGTGRFEDGRG